VHPGVTLIGGQRVEVVAGRVSQQHTDELQLLQLVHVLVCRISLEVAHEIFGVFLAAPIVQRRSEEVLIIKFTKIHTHTDNSVEFFSKQSSIFSILRSMFTFQHIY